MTNCNECSDSTTCTLCDPGATDKYLAIAGVGCVAVDGCGSANYADLTAVQCKAC